jgi:hypothetical protein
LNFEYSGTHKEEMNALEVELRDSRDGVMKANMELSRLSALLEEDKKTY